MSKYLVRGMIAAVGCAIAASPTASVAYDPCKRAEQTRNIAWEVKNDALRRCGREQGNPGVCVAPLPRYVTRAEATWYNAMLAARRACSN
jgi:hypothetical protein